ncbi:hypothetical protein [uncultured Roseovarius sp.]|uniref:hypothetical protein n=1 Tax=uncultured Roseovarius sp. TaxID=293344 RepID=UPI0026382200|nr:hypothetical protein [uncultured Roseovarius sp.]
MEQDRRQWPTSGLTGDAEEDRRRKIAAINRIKQIQKKFSTGGQQVDLFSGIGSTVAPTKSKTKQATQFKKDQNTIMKAFALGLHEYIPEDLAQHYGLSTIPEPNPPTPREDTSKAPF